MKGAEARIEHPGQTASPNERIRERLDVFASLKVVTSV